MHVYLLSITYPVLSRPYALVPQTMLAKTPPTDSRIITRSPRTSIAPGLPRITPRSPLTVAMSQSYLG